MPEREFDLYLSLLSKMLRLSPDQRAGITDEMRDHLEERFSELQVQGHSREDAIDHALDEFGDAAGIAADFTHLSKQKTRRFLMRMTLGTVTVMTLVILFASAFWPETPNAPAPRNAIAQAPKAASRSNKTTKATRRADAPKTSESAIERKLATKLKNVSWEDVPFEAIIADIGVQIEADIQIDKKFFDADGTDPEKGVTLVLSRTQISARTALELVIERSGVLGVGITFRDGLIYLTSRDQDRVTVVYNCRDLLDNASVSYAAQRFPGQGFFSLMVAQSGRLGVAKRKTKSSAPGGMTGGGRGFGGSDGGMGGAMGSPSSSPQQAAAKALVNVIQSTVRSTPWPEVVGDGATISVFNGIVVVSANHEAHREIKELLEMLRTAAAQPVGGKKPTRRRGPMGFGEEPDGGGPVEGGGGGFGPTRR